VKKKSLFHPGKVWLEALLDFENDLHEHVEQAIKDQLRFQDGRLFRSLVKHIKAKATGRDEWVAMFALYQFVTNRSRHLGYDEARRLHGAEMEAKGLRSARAFCSSLPKQFAQAPERSLNELYFRFRSIASWMEAQESFSLWLMFKDLRPAWRGDLDTRARAIQACYLSQLPQRLLTKTKHRGRELISARFPESVRVGTNYEGKPWTVRQWGNILGQAARLTEKRYDCTELERWVSWCYPVFRRYEWNAREVLDAAIKRKIKIEKETMHRPEIFRRHLMSIGLRIAGKKQKQDRTPPLADFVIHVVLPDSGKMWGAMSGFVTKKN
jgi:hypothetical protein